MPRELLTMTGTYTQFEGTNIVAENCLGTRVRDLVIKGKTYQNLFNATLNQGHVNGDSQYLNIRVNSDGFTLDSTTYTIYAPSGYEVLVYENYGFSGNKYTPWANKTVWTNSATTNNIRIMMRKPDDGELTTDEELTVDEVMGKIILLKGDYTNTDLPISVNGIESVAEGDKNLVNTATIYESMLEKGAVGSLFNPKSSSAYDVYKIEIQPNTEYLFNLVGYGQSPWVRILDKNNITVKAQELSSAELNYIWPLKTEDNSCYLVFNKPKTSTGTFQVYKKENPYTLKLAVNEEINFINLPIPLRSLPNGTCDTIEGNTLVQRVGKVVFDGTSTIEFSQRFTKTARFKITKDGFESILTDCIGNARFLRSYANDIEHFYNEGTIIWLFVSIDKLESIDVDGLKNYLSETPLEVYYELATPIIHNITVPQLRTIRGTNAVTTNNSIKPVISCKLRLSKARITN